MVANPSFIPLTPDEYLEIEEKADIKHEYIEGEIYAMAGANDTHVTITGNLFASLLSHLRGSGCRVYIADMKARIERRNRFFYPDVMVTCDPRDRETDTYKRFPCLIVEVLSDSTEGFDRGDKFSDYQTLETLQEYVLVNTKHRRIDCFRRERDGIWLFQSYDDERGTFELKSVGYTGSIDSLYENATLDPGTNAALAIP
ncbi:Uma2 family endonuclease [Pannus brasiliensis CCIBt3594]|uniref:Uma2 family endonuclease n=1 Tax=Pannus brasiliensis CCIBt3594 TaxID=1427578 RepID=A0AAW9QFQ6_9CHRO